MRSSTKLDSPTGHGYGRSGAGALLREGLAELVGRAGGLVRTTLGFVSNAANAGLGQLRSRLEEMRGAAGRRRRMRVVESLALGGRRQLLLVRCDEQEYLVGTGPDSVETIVLRQPECGAASAGVAQASASQATPALASAKTRSAGAGLMRSGLVFRERPAHGPWLVTAPEMGRTAKNRVREVESGQGRESWQ